MSTLLFLNNIMTIVILFIKNAIYDISISQRHYHYRCYSQQ